MTRRGRSQAGAVLVFVILLMLAFLALAHGALVASLSELAGSRAAARDLSLRGTARLALHDVLSRFPDPWMDSGLVWERRSFSLDSVGSVETEGAVRRLGPESWLVEGSARNGTGVSARTVRLAWALDPYARIVALPAIVTVGFGAPVALGGTLDASAPAGVTAPMEAGDCDPWLQMLQLHYAAAPVPAVAFLPDTADSIRLGLLDFERLMGAAPVTVSGTGAPEPVEAFGVCVEDEPWGWGDPDRPWRPCGPFLPIRAATSDLVVSGGVGQGLLVVDGDLSLEGGARFYGMVITRGALRLEGSASLEGMALAKGGLSVGPGATLRGSACWPLRALASQREALGGLILVSSAEIGPA